MAGAKRTFHNFVAVYPAISIVHEQAEDAKGYGTEMKARSSELQGARGGGELYLRVVSR